MPQVSIITPCYNSSEFLEETIQSVLHQNFTDWEWIITDDKSSDNSVEIIKKQQDSRIILIEAKKTEELDMLEIFHSKKQREDTLLFLMRMIIGNPIFYKK